MTDEGQVQTLVDAAFQEGYRAGLEEVAKRALEEAPDKSDLLFDPYYGMIKLKIVDEKEGT